jgi:uncharacterized membrane protein
MVREDLIVSPSHNLIWSNLLVTLLQKVEFVLYFIFPSTNKIDEHGVAEIYFKVVLNTLILILNYTIVFNLFLIFLEPFVYFSLIFFYIIVTCMYLKIKNPFGLSPLFHIQTEMKRETKRLIFWGVMKRKFKHWYNVSTIPPISYVVWIEGK